MSAFASRDFLRFLLDELGDRSRRRRRARRSNAALPWDGAATPVLAGLLVKSIDATRAADAPRKRLLDAVRHVRLAPSF